MEDYLFTFEVVFCNPDTGEIISKSRFHKPLSCLEDEDINKYLHSFVRGIRSKNSVALHITIVRDRDLPKIVEQKLLF